MDDASVETFRQRLETVAARLAAADAPAARQAVKREIFDLHKALDAHAASVAALQDDVLGLVRRWKAMQASSAPEFAAERPVVHADHLGASTFIERGWSRLALGDHEGAEQALRQALARSPDDLQATGLLGWALMLQEQDEAAFEQFARVLVREPANALARVNLGFLLLRQRRFAEAIEHLSKTIRLDSDRRATLYAHLYLGMVYLERAMPDEAQVFLRKAIALGPNLIEARYVLGFAEWARGDRAAAIDAWATGADAGRLSPWGARCADARAAAEAGATPERQR